MIVDSHAHLLPPVRMMKLIRWLKRTPLDHPVPDEVSLEVLLEEWAAAMFPDGTAGLNEWNFQLGRMYPDLIVPIGTCHCSTRIPSA